jgi:hypothetical protein
VTSLRYPPSLKLWWTGSYGSAGPGETKEKTGFTGQARRRDKEPKSDFNLVFSGAIDMI